LLSGFDGSTEKTAVFEAFGSKLSVAPFVVKRQEGLARSGSKLPAKVRN
jgi:hypothetical protein